jgi:hypothetical protein
MTATILYKLHNISKPALVINRINTTRHPTGAAVPLQPLICMHVLHVRRRAGTCDLGGAVNSAGGQTLNLPSPKWLTENRACWG